MAGCKATCIQGGQLAQHGKVEQLRGEVVEGWLALIVVRSVLRLQARSL